MGKMVVLGNEIFDDFIRENGCYIDKTELVYELAAKNRNKVTLITRPRRFGKTLAMSMMESFFDIRRDSRGVFQGLRISENHPDFCKEWMNQYPVLFLSLKDVAGMTFEEAYEMLVGVIAKLCIRFAELKNEAKVIAADQAVFDRLMYKKASKEEIKNSLQTIMRMMKTVYGKPVILLIDEYDVPLARARDSKDPEYYQKMLDVIRGILSISLKTNEYLKFAVITGCLRISKESIFTGVNNFACYSVTSGKFSPYFGFTENETAEMLGEFGLSDKMDLIRKWYDGYIFGDTEVFCPWDVTNYVADVLYNRDERPKNYWANTSSNAILDEFVNQEKMDVAEKFEVLLNGGTITEEISEDLTYEHIGDSEKNLWSVLLMTGYLSKADKSLSDDRIKLRIPNAEITGLFVKSVAERFHRTLEPHHADAFVTAMWNRDEQTASEMLSKILWNSISYFDYGEEYYHGMLNGIFSSRGYGVDSNDEAGLGRLDLRVRDRRNRRVLLLEFKRSREIEDLDSDCESAIRQIYEKGYDKGLPEGYEVQLVYGIAFHAKTARVKCAEVGAGSH